ncbi:MAG: ABC transporter substrate-binding protein [Acidimicrobiia bacterium]|nr:ABC transporter substrate-binding protein [Acidimicrobiia bacterium]
MRRALAVVAMTAVLAAACTSSGDEGTADEAATESSTTAAPASTLANTATTAAPDGGDGTDATSQPSLTATARGVTADAITLAVAQLDLDLIRQAGLAQVNHGDYELIWNTLVDDVNARGGINGRQLQLLYETYDVLVPAEQEALCVKFTEDEEVFALLAGMREDNIYCVTEQHETISVGNSGINQERIDRSQGRLVTPETVAERGIDTTVAAFVEAGVLDGDVIAVHGASGSADDIDTMEAALLDSGLDVALTTVTDVPPGDVEAGNQQFAAFAERYESEGVTAVVMVGAVTTVLDGVAAAGLDVELYSDITRSGDVSGAGRDRPEETRGTIAVRPAAPEGPEQMADPLLAECIDTFRAANPDIEVAEMRSVEPGDPDWAIGIRIACQHLRLFELAATAAGPDLTNETFLAAVEGLGDIELPALPFVSFGAGKLDGNDTAVLAEFDPDFGPSGGYVAISDLIDTTP